MVESNIIYNLEDFRTLILDKTKEGAYYLTYDDFYFEQINKNEMITREIYAVANRYTRSFNVIKYISFRVKENYTTKEMYDFISLLREKAIIIVSIFNQKKKECFLVYVSSKKDSEIEKQIEKLLEMEEN